MRILLIFTSLLLSNALKAQTAELLCEKAYEACKSIQQTEATLQATIQSGIAQNLQELKAETFSSMFTLTQNPASKFSLYQFYSETWRANKRTSGVYFGEGRLIRYFEADSQITEQIFQGKQQKPVLEPHQIFLPWVESANFFLLPQDRLDAGVIFLERAGDTMVNNTACDLVVMERDLSTAERVLPPHTFRIALRKTDGLPIAYQMSWQMGEEENKFIYKGDFSIRVMKPKAGIKPVKFEALPTWVKAKLKKSATKRK